MEEVRRIWRNHDLIAVLDNPVFITLSPTTKTWLFWNHSIDHQKLYAILPFCFLLCDFHLLLNMSPSFLNSLFSFAIMRHVLFALDPTCENMIINTPLENGWLNQVFRNIIFGEITYIGWEFWFISYVIGGNQTVRTTYSIGISLLFLNHFTITS